MRSRPICHSPAQRYGEPPGRAVAVERAGPLRRTGSTQPVGVHARPVQERGAQKRPGQQRPDQHPCTDGHPPRAGQPVDGLPADLAEQELGFYSPPSRNRRYLIRVNTLRADKDAAPLERVAEHRTM